MELSTQKAMRRSQNLPFCYLCGQSLDGAVKADRNRDHVPPTTIFLKPDRQPALWLPTHRRCNDAESMSDEQVGSLVGLLHGRQPQPKRIDVRVAKQADGTYQAGVPFDWKGVIWRWVRGFHAALYQDYLPADTTRSVHAPMPGGVKAGTTIRLEERLPQHFEFVDATKQNRAIDRVDRIHIRNQKCQYECVWSEMEPRGSGWGCCFALDLYNWKDLGAPEVIQRGCVGLYMIDRKPEAATVATAIEIPVSNLDPYDPFSV